MSTTGAASRVEVWQAGARRTRSRISTATTISSSAPMFAASTRTSASTVNSKATRSSPTRKASIPPIRWLYRLRRRVQLRLHPRREGCRRPLRSSWLAHLHQRQGRPLQRQHRLRRKLRIASFELSSTSAPRLSKSSDDLAFIGTISLETRKQIGLRTSLSLWTDYEYISSVPEMHYAEAWPPNADQRRRCLRHPHHAAAEYRAWLAAALPRAAEIIPGCSLATRLLASP